VPGQSETRAGGASGAAAAKYGMLVEKDLMVTMRDGVRIALKIYRPDGPGKFPTLFAASPYQYDTDDLPHSALFLWHEVGPVEWYVREQGYAYVHADVRGSGKSEGAYDFISPDEQRDLYELVEWIAKQSWSNGRVGGIGQSYYAWSQWFMGIQNPPALKCIAPYDGCTDAYRDTAYCGGIYGEFLTWWYSLLRVNNLHRAASVRGCRMPRDVAGDIIEHQTYDDWWKARSAFERLGEIKVPIFSIGHWGKLGLHLRGNITGYEYATAPRKLMVTGAKDVFEAHALFDDIEFHRKELLPFYDHYLKGTDTDYVARPPVRLYVRERGTYREDREWPPAGMAFVPYYLSAAKSGSVTSLNDGSLLASADGTAATSYAYPDPQWKLGVAAAGAGIPDPIARVLTFTTEPLERDLEVVGPIVLELHAASSNTDTDFFVRIADQTPQDPEARRAGRQPASVNVSKGWFRASHRAKDEARSRPYRPFYTHSDPSPIEPGRVYKYEIEVLPCAYLFRRGHRIRLEIVNGDSPVTDQLFVHQYLWYKVGTDTIHHDRQYPSRLLLPVAPQPRG
jgi:predicted acyl esterase